MRCVNGFRWLKGLAALVAALWWMVPGQARASVVMQTSLEEMTSRCDVVLHAVVEDQSITLAQNGARVLTLSRLRVKEGIRGAKTGDTVTLYQVAGRVGNQVSNIVGVNTFTVGEEVVLFGATFLSTETVTFLQTQRAAEVPAATLHPTAGYVVPHGIGLGKFVVERPAPGVDQPVMVREELGGVSVATRRADNTLVSPATHRLQQPLDVFLAEVRRMATLPRWRVP